MSLKDEKAADLAEILETVGEPVSWNGQTFSAIISDPAIGETLNIGGFNNTGDFTIKIMRSAFGGELPKLGAVFQFDGESYRVTRITNHPQYPMLVFVVTPLE